MKEDLNLAKVEEKIVNNEREDWWFKETDQSVLNKAGFNK